MQPSGQLHLLYKQLVYLLLYSTQRIEIYSGQNLEMIESIRNLYVDILEVLNVGEGNFIAVTAREAVFYALSTTSRKELFWKKMATEVIEQNVICSKYCKTSNELILLSANLIQCIQCKVKEDYGFVKQAELSVGWVVSIKQEIKKIDVSYDEELLGLLSEKGKVYIWNLKLVPTIFRKNMNLSELTENSCSFSYDEPIEQMEFKISMGENKNYLYLLSQNHLRVMVEIKDDTATNNLHFMSLLSIRIPGLRSFIQIQHSLDDSKLLSSSLFTFNNTDSIDPLILQINSNFVFYELYSLSSPTHKTDYKEIKSLDLGLTKISTVLFTNKKNLFITGSQTNNICQIKLKFQNNHPIKQHLKVFFIDISECYFSQSSNFVLLKLGNGKFCRKNIKFNNWLNSEPSDSAIVELGIRTEKPGCLHGENFYFVQGELLHIHNIITDVEKTIGCAKEIRFIAFLKEIDQQLFFVMDGEIIVLKQDHHHLEVFQKIVPSKQLLKVQYVESSSSILFKTNRGYWLYEFFLDNNTLKFVEIKKSTEHMIYGGGYWTQLRTTQIVFGSDNKALVSFSLDNFLDALSKKHNLRGLQYKLGHLINEVFTLQIENYFFFLAVILDIKKKRYFVKVLKKDNYSNQYLVIRIPRKVELGKTKLVYINNCFYIWADKQLLVIGRYPQDPIGLDYKDFTQSISSTNAFLHKPIPIQNPYFLKQLLSMGLFNQVDAILQDLSIAIEKTPLDKFMRLPCLMLSKFLNKQMGGLKLNPNELFQDLKKFESVIIQKPENTGLGGSLPLLLTDLVDFAIFRQENQRSLDFSSSVLISRVRRLFSSKQKLSTMDICWALHTNNKQELFMFLIEQPLERKEEGLSWKIIKKYCVILWYDEINQIKKWIEKIAMTQFKITKDPFDCLLWYVLLGKKNILIALLKKNEDTINVKTAEFLQRDFTQQNHKSAASKNAYALISKKRYDHAVAFFILAAMYSDAITICLNQLQDPHLAILICKLFKQQIGPDMIREIYEKTLLETGKSVGDPWMMHIAYYLLDQHVESYNCLFEEDCNFDVPTPTSGAPIVCPTWKAQFDPELSLFHPSIIFFSGVVKESLKFKREIEGNEETITINNNYENLINHSIDYYIRLNIPELAIAFTIQNLEILSLTSYRKYKLIDGYLNRLISHIIKSGSIHPSLQMLKQISDLLQVSESTMLQLFEKQISKIDCGQFLFDFYIETENTVKTKEYIYNFKNELVMFMLHKNNTRLEIAQNYQIAFHMIYWGEKVITKCQQELKIEVKDFQIYITALKIIILMKLEESSDILSLTQLLLDLLIHKPHEHVAWEDTVFEKLLKLIPVRRNRFQTSKTSKKMDILQQTFRKTNEEEPSSIIPSQTNLVFLAFRKLYFELLTCKIPAGNYLNEIVAAEKMRAEEQLSIFLTVERIQTIMNQFLDVVVTGTHAWGQTEVLSSNSSIDRGEIVPVLQLLGAQSLLTQKINTYKFDELVNSKGKHNIDLKQKIFKNGIEIFKNKSEPIKNFIINNFQGAQNEAIILFKKNLKKIDIYSSLSSRPRNADGCCLVEQDSPFNTIESMRSSTTTSPLVSSCIDILKCSYSKKITGPIKYQKPIDLHLNSYMKQLDPIPYVNTNELNCIHPHRYLPLFFIGGKSVIDIYAFSTVKNFNRIHCRELADIIKINTNYKNDLIGALDTDGNFASFHFNPSYTFQQSLQVKKTNIIDFCYLNSNLVATGSKDGSINVYDPLLPSTKNIIFKQKLSALAFVDYLPKSNYLVASKRGEVYTYDIRRGTVSRMDAGVDIGSIAVDPVTEWIYAGTTNGEIKIFEADGGDIVVLKPFKGLKKPPTISEMRIVKGNLFALSSDGVISYSFS